MTEDSPYAPPEGTAGDSRNVDVDGRPSRGTGVPPSVGELLNELWDIIEARPAEAIGLPLVVTVISGVVHFGVSMVMQCGLGLAAPLIEQGGSELVGVAFMGGYVVLGMVFLLVLISAMNGAMNIIWLRVVRGQSLEISHLRSLGHYIGPLVAANLVVGVAVFLGFLVLVVPGIVLAIGLSMTLPVMIDEDVGAIEAARRSWRLMSGFKLQFLGFSMVLSLLFLVVHCGTCGVGGLVFGPVITGGWVLFYDYLCPSGNAYLHR